MEYTTLLVEKESGYLVVTINKPPANAMGLRVLSDLNAVLDKCLGDDEVRAIVITGAGQKLFCAGLDLSEVKDQPEQGLVLSRNGIDLFFKIENYPKPIIAAMQGSAFGGGVELAMSCHIRILSSAAKVGMTEVKLGIVPGWGGTQRLPRLIGKAKALEFLLTGDLMTAEEALSLGLVNRVVPAEVVLTDAKALATRFGQGAPIAMRGILKAVIKGIDTTLENGIEIEQEGSTRASNSEDMKEGVQAFFEKRPAKFTGG